MMFWLLALLAATAPGCREAEPRGERIPPVPGLETREGGIIRGPRDRKLVALVFTGHEFAEGGDAIVDQLARYRAKASFFLTGDFLANTNFVPLVQRIIRDGHYLGPHSDKHLLYCSWDRPPKLLVSKDEFQWDLGRNVDKIVRYGVARSQVRYFLPAFEHYNREIADWTRACGLTLVNFTPGTRSTADYTGEAELNFVSSQAIFDSILATEQHDASGLNGYLLLLHIGAGPSRVDKFHPRFGNLLDALASRGYQFVRVADLLEPK